MRVIYYDDELNDDFAGTKIERKPLPEDYKYIRNSPLRRVTSFLIYRLIATPFAFLYEKIVFGEKIVGRKALKECRKSGYFLYGNHTRKAGDAFAPTTVSFPKKAYIVVNPDAVSMPFVDYIVEDGGGIPLPSDFTGMKNFNKAIEKHAEQNHVITIYPEAHIWPYYTGIRQFSSTSFHYPAKTMKPVFAFTVTYQKRKFFKRPKTVIYIDGPFYPDKDKSVKENSNMLCEKVYEAMKKRSENSTCEYVQYVKNEIKQN